MPSLCKCLWWLPVNQAVKLLLGVNRMTRKYGLMRKCSEKGSFRINYFQNQNPLPQGQLHQAFFNTQKVKKAWDVKLVLIKVQVKLCYREGMFIEHLWEHESRLTKEQSVISRGFFFDNPLILYLKWTLIRVFKIYRNLCGYKLMWLKRLNMG